MPDLVTLHVPALSLQRGGSSVGEAAAAPTQQVRYAFSGGADALSSEDGEVQ